MKTIFKISILALCMVAFAAPVLATPSTNAGSNQYLTSGQSVILQGSASSPEGRFLTYQWTCTGGSLSNGGSSQPTYTAPYISGQATYTCTFRATDSTGLTSSSDLSIYVNSTNPTTGTYYQGNILGAIKSVRNLSSGVMTWSNTVNANPGDTLEFAIAIKGTANQDFHNVVVTDVLPTNLTFFDYVKLDNSAISGNITSGINIGNVLANQTKIVSYQTRVAPESNFNYGTTTLNNSVSVSSQETTSRLAFGNATVVVNKGGVSGVTTVNTGLTNNLFEDSFFLPLMILLLTAWLYFSGRIYVFADWMGNKIKR